MQKSFVQLKRAWYGKANLDLKDCLDEIWINVKAKNSECKEFCIRWYNIGEKSFRQEVLKFLKIRGVCLS